MNKINIVLISAIILSSVLSVNAETGFKLLNAKTETIFTNTDMVIKDNFIKSKYASAENRFIQNNVKASYDDFDALIKTANHDDYVYLLYGIKMAEYGMFDLTDKLIERLDNNHFTASYVKDIRKFYYPSGILSQKDIITLADAYSNIVYNNMALETTSELINSTSLDESDYKNYLIALGYYKSNNLNLALKYINNAIKESGSNINYLCLKAKILSDQNKSGQALKVLKEIKKTEFLTIDFKQKVRATEEYVLYKTAKSNTMKDYHLAYYYHLQDKSLLATKVLQSSILTAKQYSSDIYALLGRIYYENNEQLKAKEYALRAYKENKHNYLATLTLADINYDTRNYKDSLSYYKKAKRQTKDPAPTVGIAKSYLALDQSDKAKKMYEKLLKNNKMNEDLLVESLKVIPHRVDYYLPRVASIDLSNNDIWLGLANIAIKDGNYTMAATYLNNSYYIDENNFKYYYYLSLLLRAKGDVEAANLSLMRCASINADYATVINSGYSEYYGN